MNLSSEEAILVTGSPEAVSEVFDCERCVVIDWKNEIEDTLWAFQCCLPESFLGYDCPDLAHVELRAGSRTETVALERVIPASPWPSACASSSPRNTRRASFATALTRTRPATWCAPVPGGKSSARPILHGSNPSSPRPDTASSHSQPNPSLSTHPLSL